MKDKRFIIIAILIIIACGLFYGSYKLITTDNNQLAEKNDSENDLNEDNIDNDIEDNENIESDESLEVENDDMNVSTSNKGQSNNSSSTSNKNNSSSKNNTNNNDKVNSTEQINKGESTNNNSTTDKEDENKNNENKNEISQDQSNEESLTKPEVNNSINITVKPSDPENSNNTNNDNTGNGSSDNNGEIKPDEGNDKEEKKVYAIFESPIDGITTTKIDDTTIKVTGKLVVDENSKNNILYSFRIKAPEKYEQSITNKAYITIIQGKNEFTLPEKVKYNSGIPYFEFRYEITQKIASNGELKIKLNWGTGEEITYTYTFALDVEIISSN